ncbi:hypothetical protein DFP72DRAFT_877923 [Ephemerocybe angulata]|uniref:Uncharacterized protein n=1 Tax=Ephemerocybe angulata TaxID=980116 RepID=A0A8H6IAR1_9AGAR|nr:hypothetical protein DFP72DRAFT_877923 [Tulosesus angulatus]
MAYNAQPSFSSPPRKGRQKPRKTTLRISPDTTTLPEYHQALRSAPAWSQDRELAREQHREEQVFSDRPPDYPDSAEEADEETELDNDDPEPSRYPALHQPLFLQKPQQHFYSRHQHSYSNPPHTASPRRQKKFLQQQQQHAGPSTPSHKRRHSSTAVLRSRTESEDVDSYLDSLLERSVHALEMSNTLLESSISTRATMSALLTAPEYHAGHAESALEARAIGLSSNLLRNWDVQEGWTEQLDMIKQGVDSLFNDDEDGGSRALPSGSISKSMPPSSSPLADISRASMEDLRYQVQPQSSQLRLAPQDRATLVSPPPRALTMHIDATSSISSPTVLSFQTPEPDPILDFSAGELMLPSTLGKRPSLPSFHHSLGSTPTTRFSSSTGSSSTAQLPPSSSMRNFSPALEPFLTDRLAEPSTPAYNMLSNLAARSSAVSLSLSTPTTPQPSTSSAVPAGLRRKPSVTASEPSSFVSSFLSSVASLRRRNSSPPPAADPLDLPGPCTPHMSPQSRSIRSLHRHLPSSPSHSRHGSPIMSKRRSVSADQHSLAPSSRSASSGRSGRSASGRVQRSPAMHVRQMTPPTEGTDEDVSSSSEGNGCVAKKTVVSLRKILDEMPPPAQPPPPLPEEDQDEDDAESFVFIPQPLHPKVTSRKPPAFMPRSPAVAPFAGTSTATASISRMFTKGVHTSSTRPREPPLKSVMKKRGLPGDGSSASPSPSPSVSSFQMGAQGSEGGSGVDTPPPGTSHAPTSANAPAGGEVNGEAPKTAVEAVKELSHSNSSSSSSIAANLGTLVTRALLKSTPSNTPPSSGMSTPKRISFATLPESYASTKPEGEAGSVSRKRDASSRKARRKKRLSGGAEDDELDGDTLRSRSRRNVKEENSSWWAGWLSGSDGYGGRERERVEDRVTRRMGMTMGMHSGGVLDEWGI